MLFLFDIDGTLLRPTPPAHRLALCAAAESVFGVHVAPLDLGQTAGMLDSAIARRMLRAAGVPNDAIEADLTAFFTAAAAAYERHALPDLRPFHTPYAQPTLERLAGLGACLGLVTGSMQRIAWTKLHAAGLATYFTAGAFGDEATERDELPPLALARIRQQCGRTFAPEAVFVVGDTPADVACGAACGLRTIAVATGPVHSLQELRAAGPDFAFADLRGVGQLGSPAIGKPVR
jgi:phosphoglycolate phosphatase